MQEDPMTHTSKPDIAAIRARAEAATKGRWHSADAISPKILIYAVERRGGEPVRNHDILYLGETYCDVDGKGRANMNFIAHARTDIPALCDRVEALERLLREACDLAISFDVHGSQPGERDRVIAIRQEAFND
jgi:hypothetical protein